MEFAASEMRSPPAASALPPAFVPSDWKPSISARMNLIQFIMRNMKKPILSVMLMRYCILSPVMNFIVSSHVACTIVRMTRSRRQ